MPREKAAEARFWNRYLDILQKANVPEKARRWYVIRVEHYIEAHSTLRLRLHSASVVHDYLQAAGRDSAMEGWRFSQLTQALQLLFTHLIHAPWANDFDWEFWLASGRELENRHPTIARHNSPICVAPPPPAVGENISLSPWREKLIAEIRRRNYSIRTEEAYVHWVQRFLGFNNNAAPERLNAEHVAAYLSHLALSRGVSSSTQNQALNALVFLYEQVMAIALGELSGLVAARKPQRLPSVLTRDEVKRLIANVTEQPFTLMIQLMYGTGMRLMECVRLRVMERTA